MTPRCYTPLGYQYINREPGLSAEDAAASTYEELVSSAEETIADLSRAFGQQVPVTGWAAAGGDPIQIALGPTAADVTPSSFPWGAVGGVLALGGLIYYLATRKG